MLEVTTKPCCDFDMMLHKKCMTTKNCFIISEQNNDANVETTSNMIGRDSANIINKNSSLSVKYNNLSHIHSSISNKLINYNKVQMIQ